MSSHTRQTILNWAFEFVCKSDIDGPYLEFGCFRGATFTHANKFQEKWVEFGKTNGRKLSDNRMFAFDSFEGLPKISVSDNMKDYDVFDEGQFGCSEVEFLSIIKENGVNLKKVKTVKGFYDKKLSSKLRESLSIKKASVIHIDCDLYSSAVPVLNFITPLIQGGTVLLFDDYYCYRGNKQFGVKRAFMEWLSGAPFEATHYCNYSWAGSVFILNEKPTLGQTIMAAAKSLRRRLYQIFL
ncbi:TylF/MycF/NovP-related O-methyltransferase [uncultured Roseibium sp.]|uniref:TylF/MycF/NovP-related O-methyltransferase n=1 Tax=uncultured Roseibium sp. TaxID=1936171 RepID=UPI00259851BD|nr:TylF/MycF/NovP-related O-methyltransferase [uncultured Roseibium sp.]